MKIIKVVCHQRYPENAISNLAAVLSAIHKGERVTIAEVRNAALNAVAELESRFGSENAAVRALLQAEEFDQVKVNFMVSDLESDAASIYWNINDLPAGAKTDHVFWGDLLQRTDAVWQQIKELQKVVESREKAADSRNRHTRLPRLSRRWSRKPRAWLIRRPRPSLRLPHPPRKSLVCSSRWTI